MKRALFLVVLLFTTVSAFAQEYIITKNSNKVLKGNLVEMIRDAVRGNLDSRRVPLVAYDIWYPKYEQEFLKKLRPTLLQKFKWVEAGGTYRQFDMYKSEISKGVRDVLFSSPEFSNLFIFDQSDRILSFHSDITANKNGVLDIRETITIYNGDGTQNRLWLEWHPGESEECLNVINRGLARDYPTIYRDRAGFSESVDFEVDSASVDGHLSKYYIDDLSNGTRVRIGNADEKLSEGIHTYVIYYKTNNQLAFYDIKDDLYFNVNGTGWIFSAESVSCVVHLPKEAKIRTTNCYTGEKGSKERACTITNIDSNTISYKSTRPFKAREGLTIGVTIEKGVFIAPPLSGKLMRFAGDNWPITGMFIVLLVMFVINFITWYRIGRDPAAGTVAVQFEAPDGISPADAGFLYKQEYKPEQFSAAIVDIAMQKGIKINTKTEGKLFKSTSYFFLRGSNKTDGLKRQVKHWYDWDLRDLYDQKASKEYNSTISNLNTKLHTHLEKQYRTDSEHYKGSRGFFAVNSGAATWGFFVLVVLAITSAIVVGANSFSWMVGGVIAGIFLVGFIMQYVFYKIMPAYTKHGIKVYEHILGLRMYLATAEEKRFDRLQPPKKDLELFEKFLPYAIALECQSQWADKFEDILKVAAAAAYTPYYFSSDDDFSMRDMSEGLSSGLSGAVSSASVSPSSGGDYDGGSSSSSSGSDSGSSGGGGGGGGGGGW